MPHGFDSTHEALGEPLRGMSARGSSLPLNDRCAAGGRREQRHMRAGRGASLRRSALRTDCPAVLGLVARRSTRCVRCALSAQTNATSQSLMRAARAATSPVLLGASEAHRNLPARTFADTAEVFAANTKPRGLRGRCCPAGAIWGATSSAGSGSARAQRALRDLTRRGCSNEANAVSAVSSAARPRTEQRSAVGAQRRPPPNEPPPGSACRDAPKPCQSGRSRTAASGENGRRSERQHSQPWTRCRCRSGRWGALRSEVKEEAAGRGLCPPARAQQSTPPA
jgi:hypothetical protein